ncbi:MAG TPA: hypothetical protein VL328_18660 [Gemmatimonadaceae bacterium]|jgi:hypothetical protein|nr:hypothetical protein [Gemmatimonadaceae bacterium]
MPLHARPLPTNAKSTLDALVDPTSRAELDTPADHTTAAHERTTGAPPRGTVLHDTREPTRMHVAPESSDEPWYRTERWLVVQLLALVPIVGAMLMPATYRIVLFAIGGALVAAGTVMLLRHTPAPSRPAPRGE